jgi:6-phosphogluconate dehydrogenase
VLSSLKDERMRSAAILGPRPVIKVTGSDAANIQALHDALYASKIISYAQGFMLMSEAAKEFGWDLNYGEIALMWRGGCIIRSTFLGNIKTAYDNNPQLENLALDSFFTQALKTAEAGWRKAVILAVENGIPAPAFASALSYFDGYRSERLPANLLQAQRDYFGAHTYERVDKPRGEYFHTDWTGHGGKVASTTYEV